MRIVYKYTVTNWAGTELMLPVRHTFVHVAMQYGSMCVWVELDTDHVRIFPVTLRVHGTGGSLNSFESHVGILLEDDDLVWHVYKEDGL